MLTQSVCVCVCAFIQCVCVRVLIYVCACVVTLSGEEVDRCRYCLVWDTSMEMDALIDQVSVYTGRATQCLHH